VAVKVLVANLGSTSFKYRLFDMASGEKLLAKGGVERIGSAHARSYAATDRGNREETGPVADHAAAVEACLRLLTDPHMGVLSQAHELAAIGFKAVHAEGISGVQRVTPEVLAAMEAYNQVCPAHNPPYVNAMRLLAKKLPHLPLVAAFETDFHRTIPQSRQAYAVPREWAAWGIRRYGFHGASHRYIAERAAQVLELSDAKVISCHLGGSSSLCAIEGGKSIATSMGFSPQSGLPQNNRVGDFDPFALPVVMQKTGKTLEAGLAELANQGGLQGISGVGNDLRDIEQAAAAGNGQAQLALEVYVEAIRHDLGAFLVALGGADAIIFTGGIGENSAAIRSMICARLDWFGIALDSRRNAQARGEATIHGQESRVQLWTMPTNEEIVVARQTKEKLTAHS
jgi:acetate kinase